MRAKKMRQDGGAEFISASLKGTDELSTWISDLSNECILSTQEIQIIQMYRDVLSFIQQSDQYSEAALRL